MKKLKLFPFYNNNFLETADEITDFLIKASSPDNYHNHNINTVRLFKETNNTTVIVPTNRVQYLLKFFILLSFENKLKNNKTTAFIPNIKTINEIIYEFRDFAIIEFLKESSKRGFEGKDQIINYEDKNIIIYDILKSFKELPQENPGAVFNLSEDITSLLNDFYSYNVDTEKLYDELAGKVSDGSRLPSLSDLIYGYEGIEKQFNLILKVDKAYKDKLKELNLIDSELLISSFVNADDNGNNNTGINSGAYNEFISEFASNKNKFKSVLNSVFTKHYRDQNIFVTLINDVPPIHIKFLNKLKDNANNFTIILPYIYPDFKKDIHPGYSIYFDFIAKMNVGIDEIQIKEQDVKNGQFSVKTDIANSLFKVAEQHRESAGGGESGHLESKRCKEGTTTADNKDSKGRCRRWDNVRIVSGLTIEDEVKNVCTLIKKDLLSGIKPQEIIIVLMEKSYAVPVYSAFSEFGFKANFLVPLNAFNDKDVLYFYKALEMVNSNFNYKNIINFLYLRNNNRDIIDYIIRIKDELNISDGKDNLSNLINYTKKQSQLNRDLKENKDILIEKLENFREYVYIDTDTPLSFEEFSRYLDRLTDFLFQPGFKNQTQVQRDSFINQVIKTIAYYDVLLNDRFRSRLMAHDVALQHSKNAAEGRHSSLYEFKFNFKEYFLLITKLFENYEISPKTHNSGITVMGKLEGRYSFAKSAYIMGFSEDYFPAKRPRDYLLTPKIKERLGMPSYEKLELFQKSHFLSYMMLFDMVTFSYPVSIQGKRRLKSPYLFFIEDKLTNCEIKGTREQDELNLLEKINDEEGRKTEEYTWVLNKIIQLEKVYTNNLDIDKDKDEGIGIFNRFQIDSISPKATSDYVKCGYKFYLDDIAKIKKVDWDFDEKSSLIFGVIMHAAMKKFLDLEIKPLVENSSAGDTARFLKTQEIKATYFDKFKEIILNEPGFNLLSYQYMERANKILELIFPGFLKNLFDKVKKYGFNKLDTEFEKGREILFEENNSLKSIKLKGRIDLILSHAGKRINPNSAKDKNIAWIYDFKTGYLQKSGFAEFVKSFVDNIKDDNIKNTNDYLSSIQLYTYVYMLDDEYNVLGGSHILLSNSLEAQKTGYIKDIQYTGDTDTGNFNPYITITKLLIEQIISGKNELLPNLKSKNNCKYCDYINICY